MKLETWQKQQLKSNIFLAQKRNLRWKCRTKTFHHIHFIQISLNPNRDLIWTRSEQHYFQQKLTDLLIAKMVRGNLALDWKRPKQQFNPNIKIDLCSNFDQKWDLPWNGSKQLLYPKIRRLNIKSNCTIILTEDLIYKKTSNKFDQKSTYTGIIILTKNLSLHWNISKQHYFALKWDLIDQNNNAWNQNCSWPWNRSKNKTS
jgi:hypothetical protein